jgi:DNA-binding response OmpR family regulator
MTEVLVVEDDPTVAEVLGLYLGQAGMRVRHASSGEAALVLAAATPPALAILDLMLPGMDGFEVCRRLRRQRADLPVIMLTARGDEGDRILGLEIGADDYVGKPFSPRELVLRVQSLLRRAAPGPEPEPGPTTATTLTDGDLVVDPAAHRVLLGGRELAMTSREFDLLAWFLTHPGRAVGRDELMREVWDWEFGDASTVTVHVRRLREKVEADPGSPVRLVTVFGVGYRWEPRRERAEAP